MPKVLILGCTGYIGQALAARLTQSGKHVVYGLARNPERAQLLLSMEVIPIEGSISDSAKYLELINTVPIDVVVDVSGANTESRQVLEDLKLAGQQRLESATAAGVTATKLGFIYCSGIWVHGDSKQPVNDMSPVGVEHAATQPPTVVAWRPKLEQEVLAASDVLQALVIRPALVYGRAGAIWGCLFNHVLAAIKRGDKEVSLGVETESRPPLIHVDDVASGFQAAIENFSVVARTGTYPVFDLLTSQESMVDIVTGAARALGFSGRLTFAGAGDDAFMQAMNTSVNASSTRAMDLLGWRPSRIGMAQNADTFAKAWLAVQP